VPGPGSRELPAEIRRHFLCPGQVGPTGLGFPRRSLHPVGATGGRLLGPPQPAEADRSLPEKRSPGGCFLRPTPLTPGHNPSSPEMSIRHSNMNSRFGIRARQKCISKDTFRGVKICLRMDLIQLRPLPPLLHWQKQFEDTPLSFFALHFDPSLVGFDDFFAVEQADAHSLLLSRLKRPK
jgi:hypothetical protein